MIRLEKPARRHLTLFAIVALFASMEAAPALAACRGIWVDKAWNNRISKASLPAIRTAYANGTCWIIQTKHPGGYLPACVGGNHITLRTSSATCHVFTRSSRCTGDYFPSTCF